MGGEGKLEKNEMRDHPRTRSTQPGRSNNSQEGSAPQETNAKHKLRSLSQTRSKPKVGPDIDDPALCSMPGNQADRGASSASQQTDCTNLQQPLDGPPPGRMGSNGQSTTDRFARTSSSRPHNPSKYPYERGRTSHASSGHKQSEIDIDRNKSIPQTLKKSTISGTSSASQAAMYVQSQTNTNAELNSGVPRSSTFNHGHLKGQTITTSDGVTAIRSASSRANFSTTDPNLIRTHSSHQSASNVPASPSAIAMGANILVASQTLQVDASGDQRPTHSKSTLFVGQPCSEEAKNDGQYTPGQISAPTAPAESLSHNQTTLSCDQPRRSSREASRQPGANLEGHNLHSPFPKQVIQAAAELKVPLNRRQRATSTGPTGSHKAGFPSPYAHPNVIQPQQPTVSNIESLNASAKVERLKGEFHKAKQEIEHLEKKNATLKTTLQKAKQEFKDFDLDCRQRFDKQNLRIKELEKDCESNAKGRAELEDTMLQREAELRDVKEKLRQTEELSVARNAELDSLRTFFPKIDCISATQLKQMVDDLNDEIFQLASAIVESLEGKTRRIKKNSKTTERSQSYLIERGILSEDFVHHFLDDTFFSLDDAITAFQTALQACMSFLCQLIAHSLLYDAGGQLTSMLNSIQNTESYPVFARWRAISHKQLAGPKNQRNWEEFMISILTDVLNICGYQYSSQECINKNETRIQRLVDTALKLNYSVTRETFSMEVLVFWLPTQSPFIPDEMKDENERPNSKNRILIDTPILATTGLGFALRKVRVDSQDGKRKKDDWEISIKAAVALPDSIQYKEGLIALDVDSDVNMFDASSGGGVC